MNDPIKNLIEKADALADFPGIFVPSDDNKTDDETNAVWNDFIDALNLAKQSRA